MSFTVHHDEQRSEGWFKARLGRLTGSVAKDMLATVKSGEAASRMNLRTKLVCERLTGQCQEDGFTTPAMVRGVELEPAAFAAYEALTGLVARRTGFLADDAAMLGCSLDGDVDGFTGILELKVPNSATHLRYLRAGVLPPDHVAQVTHNLLVSGAKWCDFLSYDDRFPTHLQTFLVRVKPSDLDMDGYRAKAMAFLAEIESEVVELRAR